MNLLHIFTRKPEPQPLRAIVATRSESKAVARKKQETTEALREYVNRVAGDQAHEAVRVALEEMRANEAGA